MVEEHPSNKARSSKPIGSLGQLGCTRAMMADAASSAYLMQCCAPVVSSAFTRLPVLSFCLFTWLLAV